MNLYFASYVNTNFRWQEEHRRTMPKTAPRKMTEDNAIIAISVVPI